MSFLSSLSFAADKAQVIIVKGNATKLSPGDMKATPVKRGDWLIEDTSIVTHEKSFVKVKFRDRSTMNVGPKSKVVINKLPAEKANMVNLLTGMINAEVQKTSNKKSKTKMLIKTRTAVMGVRGTKFQSIYNAENKRTSLVTIEGNVAMVDKKEEPKETIEEKKIEAKKTEVTNKPAPKPKVDEVDELNKLFEKSENVVEVTEGRFSGVGGDTTKPSAPVKIAPKQYDAMAKSVGSTKKASEVMRATEKEIKLESSKSLTGTKAAPKAGGFVDFNTGLYIPPTEDAKLDKKTGTYETKDIGKVDTVTGDYIPPKGIKVDAVKGFVIDKKEVAKLASNEDRDELKKTLSKLTKVNKEIKKQVVVNKIENKASSKKSGWGPKDHGLTVKLIPYSEQLTVENELSNSEADFYTSEANWVIVTWNQNWNDKWFSRLRLGDQKYKVDDSDTEVFEPDNNDDDRSYVSVGVGKAINPKMKVFADYVERGESFVVPSFDDNSSQAGVALERVTIDYLDVSVEYTHGIVRGFDLTSMASIQLGNSEAPTFNEKERSDMFGIVLESSAFYSFKSNLGLNSSLRYHRHVAENSDFTFTRNSLGLGLELVWDI